MKKKILLAVVLVAVCVTAVFALTACSGGSDWENIEKSGSLVIGITYYEPMNYFDDNNKLIGFDTEFAEAVCEELGVTPRFQEIVWEKKESELKGGNIDVIWNGLTVTEERKSNMDFSKAYLINKQVVVIQSKDADVYTTADSLKNASVATESGSAGETALKAIGCTNIQGVKAQSNALLELLSGNVDAAVIDETMAKSMVGNGSYENMQVVSSIELEPEQYAIGFRKGSDLTAKVNEIIDKLSKDGTLAAIAEKYGLTEKLI